MTVHAQYGNGLNGWEGCDIGDLWCCNEEEEQVIKEGVDSKREHYLLRALEYRYSRVCHEMFGEYELRYRSHGIRVTLKHGLSTGWNTYGAKGWTGVYGGAELR